MMKAINIESDTNGLDVADMKVQNPLISQTDSDSQLYHVTASADWIINMVSFKLFSVNSEGRKTTDHASFVVRIHSNQTWIDEWKRNAYLIRSRIAALYSSVEDGNAHKLKRCLAYQLFSTIVQYGQDYQGMQEVILDSGEHEATAKVCFQVDHNGFTFNPMWVDSIGHIAGFIMNASDATPSKTQVFINHGWERMRCAVKFAKGRQYQVYNRMQLDSGTTYVGDTYIFEDKNLVAIYEGVRVSFQYMESRRAEDLLTIRSSKAFHDDFSIASCLRVDDRLK
jgi:naphtho-gamma-pyrone polyketide synthase